MKKVTSGCPNELSRAARDLIEILTVEEKLVYQDEVPLKVHFGEKGNQTFIPAQCYDGLIDFFQEQGVQTKFIETNVLYRGARTTTSSHIEIAKEHGFTRIPIEIADGEYGTDFTNVTIDKEYISDCKIGKGFAKYSQFVVLSHFKGHGSAGFGGALKQLAMGFAARGGKLAQHSGISPIIGKEDCVSCGLCIEKCDYQAISWDSEGKADIMSEKCVGCAGCIAVCPVGTIKNDWTGVHFKEKVAEYAYGAQLGNQMIYISFLINVTKECDCIGKAMDYVADDIGVFASLDPVSIDAACLDLLQQAQGESMFESGRVSIDHAMKIGLGEAQYSLIACDTP